MARGEAEAHINSEKASRHSVSVDGSRVFFEAAPGGKCSEPKHLYMRANGAETLDIGEYAFLAANADGSKVLLEKELSGTPSKVLLYDTGSKTATPLFTAATNTGVLTISEDFSTIYFPSEERLPQTGAPPRGGVYRYDIATKALSFILSGNTGYASGGASEFVHTMSPDGRYYYFDAREVFGVPGGGADVALARTVYKERRSQQLYRYDSVEKLVECVSCASPSDPEPKLGVDNSGGGLQGVVQSFAPVASANGDYAFFDTPAALVPQDLNGDELPPPEDIGEHGVGPSWDIYEWRKKGVDGCAHVQGCLSLITPGTDGVNVALIGTTPSGSDVFFTTHSSLVPQDKDTSGDVYDARIGGGFPTPSPALECEGDTCSTPAGLPNDATPSSFTFTGAGNLISPLGPPVKPKARARTKTARCAKHKRCGKQTVRGKRSKHGSHKRHSAKLRKGGK
jgi:hypothetical protein